MKKELILNFLNLVFTHKRVGFKFLKSTLFTSTKRLIDDNCSFFYNFAEILDENEKCIYRNVWLSDESGRQRNSCQGFERE